MPPNSVVNDLIGSLNPSEALFLFVLGSKWLANNTNAISVIQVLKNDVKAFRITKIQIESLIIG